MSFQRLDEFLLFFLQTVIMLPKTITSNMYRDLQFVQGDAKSYPGMRSAASALSVSGRNVRAHPVINLELGGASASKSGGARVQLGGCLQDS